MLYFCIKRSASIVREESLKEARKLLPCWLCDAGAEVWCRECCMLNINVQCIRAHAYSPDQASALADAAHVGNSKEPFTSSVRHTLDLLAHV
jgi:hypothetical protein